MSHALSLLNEKDPIPYNNISSGGRGGLFPTISCCVQPPVEKETQKPSFWEKKHYNNNFSSGGQGGLFPTIPCWVQAPVEKETQKPSFWEQVTVQCISFMFELSLCT